MKMPHIEINMSEKKEGEIEEHEIGHAVHILKEYAEVVGNKPLLEAAKKNAKPPTPQKRKPGRRKA